MAAAHPSRHRRARPVALAAIILAALATGSAAAAPGSSIEVLATDTGSAGPIGWLRLCAREPGECLPVDQCHQIDGGLAACVAKAIVDCGLPGIARSAGRCGNHLRRPSPWPRPSDDA